MQPMKLVDGTKVLTMIRRALNLVDRRMVDHGVKVALVYQAMLQAEGRHDAKRLQELVLLALLHDIGAYRLEDVDQLVQVEAQHAWEHAVNGYLFLREYFPQGDPARVVLYHHARYQDHWPEEEDILHDAYLLCVADRVCIWHDELGRSKEQMKQHLEQKAGTLFAPEAVCTYLEADQKFRIWDSLDGLPQLEKLTVCAATPLEDAERYLSILVNAIDFRSRTTVNHTKSVMEIAYQLAQLAQLPLQTCRKIYFGAMLHDLGKIGTPLEILEKPGRLTPKEMDVMRQHVELGRQIIHNCVDEETEQIAMRHHERPNGGGYPLGLEAHHLTLPQRLLAVADVASALCMARSYKEAFPKERSLAIMQDMAAQGQLDGGLVQLLKKHFDQVLGAAALRCTPPPEEYDRIQKESARMIKYFSDISPPCRAANERK